MCTELYLAASHPLPLVPWIEEAPAFHVTLLGNEAGAEEVRSHLSLPHVYDLGSFMGCGCGFIPLPDDEDAAERRACLEALVAYLEAAQRDGIALQLYVTETGSHHPIERHLTLAPYALLQQEEWLDDPVLVEIAGGR